MRMLLLELSMLLPASIFILGVFGLFVWKKNLIALLISLEVMFLAANIGFVLASMQVDDAGGLIVSMIILALAGIEISIGLALVILIFRKFSQISYCEFYRIKN